MSELRQEIKSGRIKNFKYQLKKLIIKPTQLVPKIQEEFLSMTFKIEINKEECIGCGACVNACDNFELDENQGKAIVKKSKIEGIGCNQEAADICPVDAIKVKKI